METWKEELTVAWRSWAPIYRRQNFNPRYCDLPWIRTIRPDCKDQLKSKDKRMPQGAFCLSFTLGLQAGVQIQHNRSFCRNGWSNFVENSQASHREGNSFQSSYQGSHINHNRDKQ